MAVKLSGALTALLLALFLALSTLCPIEQGFKQNTSVIFSSPAASHTDISFLSDYSPINHAKVKAMWFPYFEYRNILLGKSENEFAENIKACFQNAKDIGINTLYVHLRAHGDAYYYSDVFPMGAECSGAIGEKISFDPLEIMVDIAHSLGLSFHAWVNPLRLANGEDIANLPQNYILKQWYDDAQKNGTYIVECDGLYYLNPAYAETRQLVCDGIEEILQNYNIDGIHIDDYFYPTTDISFDSTAFGECGEADLTEWRRSNTNALVSQIYATVKEYDPNVLFGISPLCTDSANRGVYADVDLWCSSSGYCDYIVPQIYFGYESKDAPFDLMLCSWKQKCALSDIQLIIGICTYKYAENSTEWSDCNLTANQLQTILDDSALSGAAIYSYSSTFNRQDCTQLLNDVRFGIKSVLTKENI